MFAAAALAEVSFDSNHCRSEIANSGAFQPLVLLLKEGSSGAKQQAVYALGNLVDVMDEDCAGRRRRSCAATDFIADGKIGIQMHGRQIDVLRKLAAGSDQRSAQIDATR